MPNDSVKLARIEENMKNLSKAFTDHENEDSLRFDRMFVFMKERFDKADKKLDDLWDNKNRLEGAFGLGKWVAGAIGGAIVGIIDYFTMGRHG